MHEKGDALSIDLLNKIRVENVDQSCEDISKSGLMQREDRKYPLHALHVFTENTPSPNKLFSIPVKDKIPKYFSILDISEVQNRNQSETGNF